MLVLKSNAFCLAFVLIVFTNAICTDAQLNHAEVLKTLGLTEGSIVNLSLAGHTPGDHFSGEVTIQEQQYTLDLRPHSIRSNNFNVRVQQADGSYVQQQSQATRLLRGNLQGVPGSRVVGSVLDTGLMAMIVMPQGETFYVEPIGSRAANANPAAHVVYQSIDVVDGESNCGVVDPKDGLRNIVENQLDRKQQSPGPVASTLIQVAELAIDADFEFFELFGTEQATLDRIELVVGITNEQFETQVEITHALSTIIIRSAEPDPYTSLDAFELLGEFVTHWVNEQQAVERDVAHLFTGKDLGNIGGIAFLNAICNPNTGYGADRIDFNGLLACSTDLLAHELGHNWSANHCSCADNTMNASLTCTNLFSAPSIQAITSFRDSLDCLEVQDGFLLGDVNLDGEVNLLDVAPFVDLLSTGGFQLEADINGDGTVNLLDVSGFVQLLSDG